MEQWQSLTRLHFWLKHFLRKTCGTYKWNFIVHRLFGMSGLLFFIKMCVGSCFLEHSLEFRNTWGQSLECRCCKDLTETPKGQPFRPKHSPTILMLLCSSRRKFSIFRSLWNIGKNKKENTVKGIYLFISCEYQMPTIWGHPHINPSHFKWSFP